MTNDKWKMKYSYSLIQFHCLQVLEVVGYVLYQQVAPPALGS
jgi:hypothetical protein